MASVRGKIANGIQTIYLSGRIDTNNAAEIEKGIRECCAENQGEDIVIDAEALEYISSAGLRVVLRLRKERPTLRIINVNNEVYDIFEMTGFTEMLHVEKAYRVFSVDGCKIIGKGAKGTVYRYDPETIVKVYHNADSLPEIQRERELARKAFVLGIPTAISYDVVKVGASYGSVFELLNASSFSQLIAAEPENLEIYVRIYAELLRQIHQTMVKPQDMPDAKALLQKWMDADRPFLPDADAKKLSDLIEALPVTNNMLHGDYHTNNIMMQDGEALLIDMDTLMHGHPIIELANVYITYVGFGIEDPTIVEDFTGLPYETALKIWSCFLPIYLQTDDKAIIRETEDKAKLLTYTRLMRHTVRRGGAETETGRKTIALCREKISLLLKTIDSLEF